MKNEGEPKDPQGTHGDWVETALAREHGAICSRSRTLSDIARPKPSTSAVRTAGPVNGFVLALTLLMLSACVSPANPAGSPAFKAGAMPLTFANVRKFFSETLRFRPIEVQKRCVIFYEGEWVNTNNYNYCVIIVENSDEDLQVTFYITDAREMNWLNEFFESSFFTRGEAENLYRVLQGKKNTRGEKVGRFRVDLSHWQPRHAEIIVVSFAPLR